MKSYVYVLLLLLVVGLSACSASNKDVSSDTEVLVTDNSASSQVAESPVKESLDVVTEVVCLKESGHLVYNADDCEIGEVIVGFVEEFDSPAVCCRLNI